MSSCPSQSDLEEHARTGAADAALERHVAACDACRARARQIGNDNAFLEDFARHAGPAPPAVSIDDAIPGYRLGRVIGRGGQAIVYEAVQESTGRRVALKMMLLATERGGRRAERFDREIRLSAGLRHPAVVTVYDSGFSPSGRPYFTMEYIAGCPITEAFDEGSALDVVVDGYIRVCDAVSHSHQRGIIHRDLKPSNVLVDVEGNPRVLDFGLAKAVADTGAPAITATGEFLGTLAYAAPEQVQHDSELADTRTDVYALGVMLYEMLTGRLPYPAEGSVAEVVRNITDRPPDPPSRHRPDIDDELETIILKTLSKAPDRRYAEATALLDDLQRYRAGEVIAAKRDSAWYVLRKTARRHRLAMGVACTLLAFLIVFSITMTVLLREKRLAAAELAVNLAASNIDRARMMNEAHTAALSEEILWRQQLVDDPAESAVWALRELYARHPCTATAALHDAAVTAVALVDDAVVSAGRDGRVVRWDLGTQAVAELLRFNTAGEPLHLSTDGTIVARRRAASTEVWSVDDGVLRSTIQPEGFDAVSLMELSASGRAVATVCAGRVSLWRGDDGELIGRTEIKDTVVRAVAIGDSGVLIACDHDVKWWDPAQPVVRSIVEIGHPRPTFASIGPEDDWIATATARWVEPVRRSDRRAVRMEAHADLVSALHVGRNALAVSASLDGAVRILDLPTRRVRATYHGHRAPVTAVTAAGDGSGVASGDERGVVRVWESMPSAWMTRPGPPDASMMSIDVSGDVAATGGAVGGADVIHLRHVPSGRITASLVGHEAPISGVVLGSDARVVSCSYDATIRMWPAVDTEPLVVLEAPGPLNDLAISPDGRTVVAGAVDSGAVHVWDLRSMQLLTTLWGHRTRVPSVDFSATGAHFASCSADASVIVWDATTFEALHVLGGHRGGVRIVRFSPDGSMLATGGDDWTVRVWSVETGAQLALLTSHEQHLFSLAFSPGGRRLASGDRGGVIHLWDVPSGRNLLTFENGGGGEPVMGLAFHGETTLVSVDGSESVGVWDLSYYDRHIEGNRAHRLSQASR